MALLTETVFTSRAADQIQAGVAQDVAYTDGLSRAFLVGALMAVLGLAATIILIRQTRAEEAEAAAAAGVDA